MGDRVLEPDPVSPARAVAGAAVAVAGVALGIGAVLMLTNDPGGDGPTVALPPGTSQTATATTTATTAPASRTAPATATTTPRVTSAPATTRPTTAPPRATPSSAPASPTSRPTAVPTARPTAAAKPPLTVLNNSRRTGLADRAARQFRAAGYPIRDVGNFTGTIPQTTIYYSPGQLDAARRLARAFDVDRIKPRFARLPGSGLTIVLTREYDL